MACVPPLAGTISSGLPMGMPFLARYPKMIKPGAVNGDMLLNVDFAPTFLDVAGVKTPPEMQGVSAAGFTTPRS